MSREKVIFCIMVLVVILVPMLASAVGEKNIAVGKPVYASSVYSGSYPVVNAVDGNQATVFGSGMNSTDWVYVDLQASVSVNGVRIHWYNPYYATRYSLYISNDLKTWTKVYTQANGQGNVETINGDVTCQYIGLYFEQKPKNAVGIKEFEVLQTVTPTPTPVTGEAFLDNLDTYDTNRFYKSDGWANGDVFNCGWLASHSIIENGSLTLVLDHEDSSGLDFSSGEYFTTGKYGYGLYEVSMKPAKGDGTVSSFFTYTGPHENNPHDEIDIEFLGKDTTMVEFNFYKAGQGGNEYAISLGFDASLEFHTYGFEWLPNSIKWYVDGQLVHEVTGTPDTLPSTPGSIMMNLWNGIGVDAWLNKFDETNIPLKAEYDWIKFTPQQ